MSRVSANQKPERPVRTRPLSGISVGSTTSKVEIRSLATSRSRSSSRAYSSRTFPLATWLAASDIDGVLLPGEGAQPVEHEVDVLDARCEVEDGVEGRGGEAARERGIRVDEEAEVGLRAPRLHRGPLDEPVGLVAREA